MLARTHEKKMQDVWAMADGPALVPPLFPIWNALLVETNRERHAADWLMEKTQTPAYWPNFSRQYRSRGKVTRHRLCAVMPGLLFVPEIFLENKRRDEILKYIHSHGFVKVSDHYVTLTKAQIEIIREIEAKLNTEEAGGIPDVAGKKIGVGQRARFLNPTYAAFFGDGLVVEVVSTTRIGVEVAQLFGCRQTVYTLAAEIEVL